MAENNPQLPDLEEPEQRHEHRDVNVWAVGRFAIALVFLGIASLGLLAGLFQYFKSTEPGRSSPLTPPAILPPAPTLETAPVLDQRAVRAAEDETLNSYGWVDQSKGVVRIPISRAIDLLAERGLPARPESAIPAPDTASVPTESGLGPKMMPEGGPLSGGSK